MVETASTMLPLGTRARDFSLLEPATGRLVSLADFAEAPALVVVFMCNHCPYVIRIKEGLAAFAKTQALRGVAVVGINSNDVDKYQDDRPELMVRDVEQFGYSFPYLFDQTQEVAKAYHAACTPDIYLFDGAQRLVYRGQFDDARPSNNAAVDGHSLVAAVDAVLAGDTLDAAQRPSLGCNIKWKPGNEPNYFG